MGFFDDVLTRVPVIGGLFDDSAKQSQDQVAGSQAIWNSLKVPDLEWQNYNPENLVTEDAQYQTLSEDPEFRSRQLSALSKLDDLSTTGMSAEDELGFLKARQLGDQQAKGRSEAILANAAQRGISGSGLELGLREQGNQEAAQRAQEAAMQQAAAASQNRNQYLQAYANQLGSQRDQDLKGKAANADIINKFNMANTQQRNQTAALNNQQRNSAQQQNQQGKINTQQQNYNNQVTKLGGQSGANLNMANAYAAENAANTSERNNLTSGLLGFFKPEK